MIFALVLAMISAILALIAPNKLSDFTDVITEGLKPNSEKLETITISISNHFTSDKINEKIPAIMMDTNISKENKQKLEEILHQMSLLESREEASRLLFTLPDCILLELIEEIKVDYKTISRIDQLACIKLMSSMNGKEETELLSMFDQLPTSIYEEVKPRIDMDLVYKYVFFLGALYVISAIFSFIQNFSMTTVSNNFARKLRTSISSKINLLPLKYFDMHETGDVLKNI